MTKLEHALHLASLGFYVFPIVTGKKSPPAVSSWQDGATRDRAVLMSWWGNNPNDNIGIFTGKFQDIDALLVVDVDTKGEKQGETSLLRLELGGWELPDTLTGYTPSGGRHLIYRVQSPVRQGTNILGPGLDIRSRGGYIVGAGSTVNSGTYTLRERPLADAPGWLIERCGEPRQRATKKAASIVEVDEQRADKRVKHYLLHEASLAIEGQGGDETTYKVAAVCKDLGVTAEQAINLAYLHWNDRCVPPWELADLTEKFHNAYKYGVNPPGVAAPEADFTAVTEPRHLLTSIDETKHPYDKLNESYAFVLAGGGAHILWETTDVLDRYRLEHLDIVAFNAKFAPQKMTVGKIEKSVSKWWLEWKERRSYDGLVFMPEKKAPERFYNLWRGFSVVPATESAKHPAVEAFLEHARDNACRGNPVLFKWLMGFFAHLIQRPWEKPLVACVFRGGKGVGKNALIERIGALLGGHFLLTSNRRYLVSNFNGHLENCLLFALDEAFWSGDKQAEGIIKDLITGREHVIEHKGKEPYTVANKTRIAIIGNEDWLVPASHDERRFAVFDVGDGRKQDLGFFQAMREGMEGGGYRALLRYLLDYDLAGIDLNQAPSTKGLMEQKQHTMDPLQQWWLDCLENGRILCAEFAEWPVEIECERFRAAFRRYVKERQIRSRLPEDRIIGRLLKQCAPGIVKKRMSKREDGQPYAYVIPELKQARGEWDTWIGHATEWTD